jgi:hypothetical protein
MQAAHAFNLQMSPYIRQIISDIFITMVGWFVMTRTRVGNTWNNPTQLKYPYIGQLDNVIRLSGTRIENELEIRQPVEVKSTNDLIVKLRH